MIRRLFFALALALAAPAFAQTTPLPNGVEVSNGPASVVVTALTDSILRVRVATGLGFGENASWAVPADVRRRSVPVQPLRDGFRTAAVAVHVDPRTLQLIVSDLQGRTIVADSPDAMRFEGRGFTLRKSLPIGEHIYGLGDKTGPLDRRGGTFVDWNTDAFGFAPSTDPIYKSIPFFIGVGRAAQLRPVPRQQLARSFDFGHRDADDDRDRRARRPIDYYVIAGPTCADVVRRYTDLTGKAPLPPLWALGYHQSRYSYSSDARCAQIAEQLRADRIPADVIWLDIDYQDRYRPFTVNTKAFPDLRKLISDLRAQGFRLVTIVDPHSRSAEPGLRAYDSGSRATTSSQGRRLALRRAGLAGAVGFPRLHPRRDRVSGGAGCSRTSSPSASPASGTT